MFTSVSQDHSVDGRSLSASYPPVETLGFPSQAYWFIKRVRELYTPSSLRIASWALQGIVQAVKVKGAADVGSSQPLPADPVRGPQGTHELVCGFC